MAFGAIMKWCRLRWGRCRRNSPANGRKLMGAVGVETAVGDAVEGRPAVRRDRGERLGRVVLLFGVVGDGERMVSSLRHGCLLVLQVAGSRFAMKVRDRGLI